MRRAAWSSLKQFGERDVLDIGALSAGSYVGSTPARGSIQRWIMIQ